MKLQFIGSGDAFGSGGRFNTCFHVTGDSVNFLIDCGASSLIALKKCQVDINSIHSIFFTHFHADHFGGIPFFMLDSQFFSKRERALTLVGPVGLQSWYERVMETSFPGSSKTPPKFNLIFKEIKPGQTCLVDGVNVSSFQAHHGNPGGPFLALRFLCNEKSFAYTGDTEWTDQLIDLSYEVDLLIAEAYFFDKKIKFHLDLESIEHNLSRMKPRRLILTHMSQDMLVRANDLKYELASDGLVVEF